MEPITRKEKFYAAAAGDAVRLPEPVTREEKWLHRIATRFGDVPIGGDTLTWDGNTEGLLKVDVPNLGTFYKVSDVALTWDEAYGKDLEPPVVILRNAAGADIGGPGFWEELVACTDDIVRQVNLGDDVGYPDMFEYPVVCYADYAIGVFEDNVKIGIFEFPEKGIYFNPWFEVRSLWLANCTKFPSVKRISPKYLPEGVCARTLLWENPDVAKGMFHAMGHEPTGVSPEGYGGIEVVCVVDQNDLMLHTSGCIPIVSLTGGDQPVMLSAYSISLSTTVARILSIGPEEIVIDVGFRMEADGAPGEDAGVMIPYRIYGISSAGDYKPGVTQGWSEEDFQPSDPEGIEIPGQEPDPLVPEFGDEITLGGEEP